MILKCVNFHYNWFGLHEKLHIYKGYAIIKTIVVYRGMKL